MINRFKSYSTDFDENLRHTYERIRMSTRYPAIETGSLEPLCCVGMRIRTSYCRTEERSLSGKSLRISVKIRENFNYVSNCSAK